MSDKLKTILISFILFQLWMQAFAKEPDLPSFTIEIKCESKIRDSLLLVLENTFYFNINDRHHSALKGTNSLDDAIHFEVYTEDTCGYFSIAKQIPEGLKKQYDLSVVMNHYFWEKGDSLLISIAFPHPDTPEVPEFAFKGKGSYKYTARYNALRSGLSSFPAITLSDTTIVFPTKADLITIEDNIYKDSARMSSTSYQVLKADVLYGFNLFPIVSVITPQLKNKQKRQFLVNDFRKIINQFTHSNIDKKALSISSTYQKNYIRTLMAQTLLETGKKNPDKVLLIIQQERDQNLRDHLLAAFLVNNTFNENFKQRFIELKKKIIDPKCLNVFMEQSNRYLGQIKSDYWFLSSDSDSVKLSDFKGKVVLLDLWFSGCGGCLSLYQKTLAIIEEEYHGRNDFVVVSVNVDKKIAIWKEALSTGKYSSMDKAINLNTGNSGMRHPIVQDWGLQGMPCLILLNKEGGIEFFNTTNLYDPVSLAKTIDMVLASDDST